MKQLDSAKFVANHWNLVQNQDLDPKNSFEMLDPDMYKMHTDPQLWKKFFG